MEQSGLQIGSFTFEVVTLRPSTWTTGSPSTQFSRTIQQYGTLLQLDVGVRRLWLVKMHDAPSKSD
jgi:hypothetical protein